MLSDNNKKNLHIFSLPSEIPACIKQNTGTPLRFPLVCGLAADKRLITNAVTVYKTDTLIQFGPFMLFIDNATPPPHRRPGFMWSGRGPLLTAPPSLRRRASSNMSPPDPPPPHTPQVSRIFESLYDEVDMHEEFDSVPHANAYSAADTLEVCDMLSVIHPTHPPPSSLLHNWTYFCFMQANAE